MKCLAEEVYQAMIGVGSTANIGTARITNGVSRAFVAMNSEQNEIFKQSMKDALQKLSDAEIFEKKKNPNQTKASSNLFEMPS